jgi:hypothetical protein
MVKFLRNKLYDNYLRGGASSYDKRFGETFNFPAENFGLKTINGTSADATSSLFIGGIKLEGSAVAVTYNNGTRIDNKFALINAAPPAYLLEKDGSDLKVSLDNVPAPTDQITISDFTDGDFGISISPDVANLRAGAEFRVNTYITSDQQAASVAGLSNGEFVVVWESLGGQDGDRAGVFAQRYDPNSKPVGAEFQVNTYTTDNQSKPSVTGLASGGFVITWSSTTQDGNGQGVYAQIYDVDGNAVGAEFQVNTYITSTQDFPSIAGLTNGDFIITWESWVQDGDNVGIFAQRYDSNSNTIGTEFQVNTYTTNGQQKPAVAALTDGEFVISWESNLQYGVSFDIYAQRYNLGGDPLGGEFRVSTLLDKDQHIYSSVIGLAEGRFLVTWSAVQWVGDPRDVYAHLYDPNGNQLGSAFRVNTYTTDKQHRASSAALADGGFIIAWSSFYQDGPSIGVFAQRYNADGSPYGAEFQVNTYTANNQRIPSTAGLDNGGFVIAWQSWDQDGFRNGIFAKTYTPGYDKVLLGTNEAEVMDCGEVSSCVLVAMEGNDKLVASASTEAVLVGDDGGVKEFEIFSEDTTYSNAPVEIKGFKSGDTLDISSFCLDDRTVLQNNGTAIITLPEGKTITVNTLDNSTPNIEFFKEFRFGGDFGNQFLNNTCANDQFFIDGFRVAGNATLVSSTNITNSYILFSGDVPFGFALTQFLTSLKVSLFGESATNEITIPVFENNDLGVTLLPENQGNVITGTDEANQVLDCSALNECIAIAPAEAIKSTLVASTKNKRAVLVGNKSSQNIVFEIAKAETDAEPSRIEIRGYKVGDIIDLSQFNITSLVGADISVTESKIEVLLEGEDKLFVFILPADGDAELSLSDGKIKFEIVGAGPDTGGSGDDNNSNADDIIDDTGADSTPITQNYPLIGLVVTVISCMVGIGLKIKGNNILKGSLNNREMESPTDVTEMETTVVGEAGTEGEVSEL